MRDHSSESPVHQHVVKDGAGGLHVDALNGGPITGNGTSAGTSTNTSILARHRLHLVCLQQIEIIQLVIVLGDGASHLGAVHPCDVILQGLGDQKGGIRDYVRTHAHLPLLHEGDGRPHGLRHLQSHHDHRQPPSAQRRCRDVLRVLERRHLVYQAQIAHLGEQLVRHGHAKRIAGLQRLELGGQLRDHAADAGVGSVVLPVLDVIPSEDLGHPEVVFTFPGVQVHLAEQLLLMVL
mmetsp:Transcript_12060/g.33202  ORF Transcript_12060/g.33202 Transcript_12060/m.33202 type:complete len:236 (-) Transcript_12060:124-831(-)